MFEARAMKNTIVLFLIVLTGGRAHAADIERMTDLIVGMMPHGPAFDQLAAEDPNWPMSIRASAFTPEQLLCARAELSSAGVRKGKLTEVRAYAASDAATLQRDFDLLNRGLAERYQTMIAAQATALRSGDPFDNEAWLQSLSSEERAALSALQSDPKYQALRKLLEIDSTAGVAINPFDEAQRRQALLRSLGKAFDACRIALPLALANYTAPKLHVEFDAKCTNEVDTDSDGKKVAPKPDPARPLTMPDYPPVSRRMGEEGTVMVSVYVTDSGAIGEAKLNQSSGFVMLDNAALEGTRNWKMQPGQFKNKPACFWVRVPVVFKLSDPNPAEAAP
jgi:TonB family protein